MNDVKDQVEALRQQVETALANLDIQGLKAEQAALEEQMGQADFWQDQTVAQAASKRLSKLKIMTAPWLALRQETTELAEFVELGDESLIPEIKQRLARAQDQLAQHQTELSLSGQYDQYDAILNIHSGAGGLDAQDWAQMLMRMYVKWAEKHHLTVEVLNESAGEEGGVKNASLSISGAFAYGHLKSEHGVHRLVRLSPFNSAQSRETSFAQVEVLPQIDEPDELQLDEKDLRVDVYRASGHGGQSVNTTDSAVRITHIPTGITVAIQNERSQLQNKDTALKVLRSKLAQLALEQHAEELSAIKGPNQEAAWGNQIRSYVLNPYTMVKDNRTKHQTSNVAAVLDGDLDDFIEAYLHKALLLK